MTQETPKTVTPAPDPIEVNDADFAGKFDALYGNTWGTGAIPAKYNELTGVSISVVTRCEPCLAHHLRMAHGQKATKEEFVEAIRLGLLTGGSITIPTARYGYKVLQDLGVLNAR
jgi:AhpD family alkylhydroperoxidase